MKDTTIKTENLISRLKQSLSRFQLLQWKLTFAYTLSTVVTTIILGTVALLLLWYINFWSNRLPAQIATGLQKIGPTISPYLAQSPPDKDGLEKWLQEVITEDNYLIVSIPKEEDEDENSNEHENGRLPAQFGAAEAIAIVDKEGQLLATFPPEEIDSISALETHFSVPEAAAGFQAALRGETEPSLLATRGSNGDLIATAPIFDENEQLLGAIFVKTTLPFTQSEFLWVVLSGMILPVAGIMLVVGIIAGVLFGFFIARGLTRRLKHLDQVADDWSEGKFNTLVRDTSGDELGQLARQLNHMAIQLQNLLHTRQELATLEERNRLARDLHDSVKQQVFATSMQVGAARALIEYNPETAKRHLSEADKLVRQAQQELTTLIQELRPAALEGKGLATALRDYIDDWSRQTQIETEIRIRGERPLSLPLEQTLFRVAQEALANIARHSQAKKAEIDLDWLVDEVVLTIIDDGIGFNHPSPNGKGMGLQSMRERVEALSGDLKVDSQINAGTRITVQLETDKV